MTTHMNGTSSHPFQTHLSEKLADSVTAPLPVGTPRVFGAVRVPGKVTAVLGMRRACKTMFLHQTHREAC